MICADLANETMMTTWNREIDMIYWNRYDRDKDSGILNKLDAHIIHLQVFIYQYVYVNE